MTLSWLIQNRPSVSVLQPGAAQTRNIAIRCLHSLEFAETLTDSEELGMPELRGL
jgi:hypothetical protein